MAKIILLDVDGVVIKREMYFSERLAEKQGIPLEKIIPFFQNEFKLCMIGQADLKEELVKYINDWNWSGTVDDLLNYWFKSEADIDKQVIEHVQELRRKGTKCYLITDNEKYRVEYLVDVLKIEKFFDGIFSSAIIGCTKSQEGFWSNVYDKFGKENKYEIIVLDDEIKNVECAQNFGFNAKLYTKDSDLNGIL